MEAVASVSKSLAPQVADIAAAQAQLQLVVADLTSQQGQLTAAQAALAAQQTALTTAQADLTTAQAAIAAQVAFLAGQTASAEAVPGSLTTVTTNPATSNVNDTWVAYNSAADATVTITTSSTGKLIFQAGGYLSVYSLNFAYARGFIGVEILQAGSQVRAPGNGDGNFTSVWDANAQIINANAGHQHMVTLSPNTTYTLRCRRGWSVGAGNAGAIATTVFQGTSLTVTKLGM
jgi:hypothetical protein